MPPDPILPDIPDKGSSHLDVVLTYAEARRLMRLSDRTLNRLHSAGHGPPRIQLTSRRVGYWKNGCVAWLQARTVPAKAA
jgi:predicted DNA-binding transcriptional regulator AlpA